ncbi:hypothetical protein LINPERHAP1_LOCUS17144 [Linum perenne]
MRKLRFRRSLLGCGSQNSRFTISILPRLRGS